MMVTEGSDSSLTGNVSYRDVLGQRQVITVFDQMLNQHEDLIRTSAFLILKYTENKRNIKRANKL